MNLTKLFETQAELDNQIVEKHNLQGQDLLDKKILALHVELGELANEWRGFKFWSEDQEPRTIKLCRECGGNGHDFIKECESCNATGLDGNPLLEEYVDCLHFILSIGNDLSTSYEPNGIYEYEKFDTTSLFLSMNFQLAHLEGSIYNNRESRYESDYELVFNVFLSLGKRLDFTWKEIEQAYYNKNKINHERQEQGY